MSFANLTKCSMDFGERGDSMEGLERLLVPVDGSAGADKAVDIAVLLAKSSGAVIDLLYVSYFDEETDDEEAEEFSWLPASVMASSSKQSARILAQARERIPGDVEAAEHVVTGTPAEAIVAFAEEHGKETVVIGGRGLGMVRGFFAGSVSQEVMDSAPGNVILVK